jgi:uncharacterized membrane protein YeaQ/YmgE (transglycosylase-associated protein family)
MLIILIAFTGVVAGLLPGRFGLDKPFSVTNIVIGVVGASVGAFLGFGDAPLFLEYSLLHERTLMVGVSILAVFFKVLVVRS